MARSEEEKKKEFGHKVTAERLRNLHETRGMNAREAANFCGILQQTYNRYCLGAKIPKARQLQICAAFGLPPYYFDTDIEFKKSSLPISSPKSWMEAVRVDYRSHPSRRPSIVAAIRLLFAKPHHQEEVILFLEREDPQ